MRRIIQLAFLAGLIGLSAPAHSQNQGFQVNRYEPTTAGEWSFSVDHPWYSSMRYFAAGITLNYGHNPLVFGLRDTSGNFIFQDAVIAHQLIGHVDLAGSFLDRVLIAASLPITFLERGNDGSNGIRLVGGTDQPAAAVGDLRLGAKVRLFGQPYKGAISMSLGVDVWIPINSFTKTFPNSVGESGVRVLPKAILGGLTHSVMWSFTAGFLYRPTASIGLLPAGSGNTVGPEIQLGAAIAYANTELRLAVGPEVILSTVVSNGFKQDYTSLELLLGLHYNIARLFQLSVGGGVGLLREPGTPDGRALLRFAYAPMRDEKPKDRDHDGISDKEDACIDEPGVRTTDPRTNGCPPPPPDSDEDGIIDPQDKCPTEPKGKNPDPEKRGCPLRDKDGDGVFDPEDLCVDEPMGTNPDPDKKGCPLRDKDGDGVFDPQDQCVDVAAGPNPDPTRPGCPDKDSDADGVYDGRDQCKTVPAGMFPDTAKPGCPLPDRDKDYVPDPIDACPDQPGAPSTDPKKNGCPGMVEVKNGQIVILRQVFFATNKDVILKKSFPVLDAVVSVLKSTPQVKKVAVEGHTDNKGKPENNRALSERRAQSVMKYLVDHGIEAGRLEAKGYGPDRPIADNAKEKGRALNRRTDFRITDPPMSDASGAVQVIDTPKIEPTGKEDKAQKPATPEPAQKPVTPAPPAPPAKPEKGKKGKKGKDKAADSPAPAPEAGAAPAAADKPAEAGAAPAAPTDGKADKKGKKGKKGKAEAGAAPAAPADGKAADKPADKPAEAGAAPAGDKPAKADKKAKKGKKDKAAAPAATPEQK